MFPGPRDRHLITWAKVKYYNYFPFCTLSVGKISARTLVLFLVNHYLSYSFFSAIGAMDSFVSCQPFFQDHFTIVLTWNLFRFNANSFEFVFYILEPWWEIVCSLDFVVSFSLPRKNCLVWKFLREMIWWFYCFLDSSCMFIELVQVQCRIIRIQQA